MKKLILFIAIIAQGAMLTAQDTLIYGNLLQTTYDSGAFILIDKPAYAETRYSSCATIAPKISYLDEETSTLNKDLEFGKITDGTTERKVKVRLLNPDILSYPTVGASNEVEWIAVYDSYDSDRDEKVSFTNFISYLVASTGFTSAVDGRFGNSAFTTATSSDIDARVDEDYILDLTQTDTLIELLYNPGAGLTDYGSVYFTRIGNQVVGTVQILGTCNGCTSTQAIPSEFQPSATVRFSTGTATRNSITLYRDTGSGQITFDFDIGVGDGTNSIGFAYNIY